MEKITGYVDHIIFRNADNGYTVMVLVVEEEEITCVGNFSDIAEGENMEATGEYTEHPTYGRQFKIESYIEKAPEDELAIERYLGSGAIKGIGLALAARIVRRFKKDTFRIIEEEPERLAEIKGISQRKAMEIADQDANAKLFCYDAKHKGCFVFSRKRSLPDGWFREGSSRIHFMHKLLFCYGSYFWDFPKVSKKKFRKPQGFLKTFPYKGQ